MWCCFLGPLSSVLPQATSEGHWWLGLWYPEPLGSKSKRPSPPVGETREGMSGIKRSERSGASLPPLIIVKADPSPSALSPPAAPGQSKCQDLPAGDPGRVSGCTAAAAAAELPHASLWALSERMSLQHSNSPFGQFSPSLSTFSLQFVLC